MLMCVRLSSHSFDSATTEELQNCLAQVELAHLPLDMKVVEGGENLSVGQRQMLCFGRAILRKSRLLMLDEATASVDGETDALLQRMVRTTFSDRTTITIAHRLESIVDSSRILVLDAGNVVEFDEPAALLADPNSTFAGMVAAEKNAAR